MATRGERWTSPHLLGRHPQLHPHVSGLNHHRMSGFQFPNIKDKLDAPTKKSAFERAKAEAEAKRRREAEETAAVYKEFVESFEDNSRPSYSRSSDRGGHGNSRGNLGPSRASPAGLGKRHFTSTQGRSAISGPGTLGPLPTKKRDLDTYRSETSYSIRGGGGYRGGYSNSGSVSGVLGFDDTGDYGTQKAAKSERGMKFGEDEDDEDDASKSKKEQAKPTISMTHLPPKTTKLNVMEMMQPYFPDLTANQVSMQVLGGSGGSGRKSTSALITLKTDTAASEIDAAVNGLSNRYMGFGFRLGISRHLPSTIISSTITPTPTLHSTAPFNARPVFSGGGGGRGGFGRGGFAPPSSFGHSSSVNNSKYIVSVNSPKDLKTLRLIHKTVEAVITHGPEFEALLMAMPSIISDERYFWLWDTKSSEHVYYRWRLWDVFTASGSANDRKQRSYAGTTIAHLFDNSISWELPPKKQQKFEFVTELKDFIEDEEYHSSSDEDDDIHQAQDSNPNAEDTKTYLGPLRRAKLYHLLSRVPTTTGTLRRGDVARLTGFAVEHAYAAEEIVEIMCANVSRPVAFSSANPEHDQSTVLADNSGNANVAKEDQTPAKLIALYLISDILSNSGLGVRNVWRYRQYFDQRLREGKIFEGLAEVGEKENWGKIRQEKWRRSIQIILSLWENWNIFPQTSHEALRVAFSEPNGVPQQLAAATGSDAQKEETAASVTSSTPAIKSRWRTVPEDQETGQAKFNPYLADGKEEQDEIDNEDVDGEELVDEDVDGEPMEEDDEDVDGEPMIEDDDDDGADGEPMDDADNQDDDPAQNSDDEVDMFVKDSELDPLREEKQPAVSGVTLGSGFGFKIGGFGAKPGSGAEEGRKKRMKAEDMFANEDSDE
ncbi:hypothetical protein H072_5918 [Dactylellina haptotyla CBS 200.50]|uniref:CID domain-containing protein n=1 Tax=Dactylellina haptotyla (strain CBS 200.50) TaxID=1284197 RepID=S8BLK1_DACHA|nr:hypothetical protein H072_5918 [Dactylellina haptotyla CBS 200.50]